MTSPLVLPDSLAAWLVYIESQHPKSIAMGLERVQQVRSRLQLDFSFPLITVGGTNGKGSTCAMLERIYCEAGYRIGCYSSPHFLRYNERVRVNGMEADDAALCAAFTAVEQARGSTPLTYFEFGTLAAAWHFVQSGLDVLVMEVGLGGRLDAVNLFDPDCAVVTGIDLDHMDYLGDSRESIGFEKAGIFRTGIPAICGDRQPPASLIAHAQGLGADLQCLGLDFEHQQHHLHWAWMQGDKVLDGLLQPALTGDFQHDNAACVVAVTQALQARLPLSVADINAGLQQVQLAGRYQQVGQRPLRILDVAHNPQAARALAVNLQRQVVNGRTLAVFAMLQDKDIGAVVDAVSAHIDVWYIAGIDLPRGASAVFLADTIARHQPDAVLQVSANVTQAYALACQQAAENDRIIVFGSFFTVADVMRVLVHDQTTG
ncbi:bifunctional tetrahydrofolate synthase/dihydrofolate synthase [Methylobacillus flagellatus]|uniref:bifunctional tetrahydrofolate synthase/dihydrofolate synthase n=1 Tax=Methylobacillus flagellatus TaxID=405 RepID=UPI00256FB86A|nr:bifunctional tetrahydrofolate synthase/dihydrofolate synthase [Methylobacillus flagellatus]